MKLRLIMVIGLGALTLACIGQTRLEHKTVFRNQGKRSEIRKGYLYLGEFLLPDVFNFVQQSEHAWKFWVRTNPWGDEGYHEVEPITPTELDQEISQEQIDQKWYQGAEKLKGTPEDWIFVSWGDAQANWIAPAGLADWLAKTKPPCLDRAPKEEIFKDL